MVEGTRLVHLEALEAYAIITAVGPTYLWFQLSELVKIGQSLELDEVEAKQIVTSMARGAVQCISNLEMNPEQKSFFILYKLAANFSSIYRKSIFQGGEKHSHTGHSFVAQVNYATALGRKSTRVVSCNTTSIVRTLGDLQAAGLLKKARGVIVRRAPDPWESAHSGIMNTVVPEKHILSHQGPDAQTVLPDIDVMTTAVVAAHTNCHLHSWCVELVRPGCREEVLDAFRAAPRIAFLQMSEGIFGLNSTLEMMADLGRPRGDMWEVGLWEDSITVAGSEAFYNYQVYNQVIVIPETIDAIRALTCLEIEASRSIAKTDQSMGLVQYFITGNGYFK